MSDVGNKSKPVATAREYFSLELKSVMERQQVIANQDSVAYLADLLMRHIHSDVFFVRNTNGKLENNVLADLYYTYIQATPEMKKLTLRRLGDICLLVSGFFSDSLKHKLGDVDYYHGMGGSAYLTLSQFHLNDGRDLFQELGEKFVPFSDVLSEMSERSGLQTNSDLLRLYERWLLTGSERLRGLLSEHGIAAPVKLETKAKH